MKKLLLIINPMAGKRTGAIHLCGIIGALTAGGFECTVVPTTPEMRGKEAFTRFCDGKDTVVCVGGDGTFNEVVAGMAETGFGGPLGYIPAGSTNDFASSLGLRRDPVEAARDIVSGEVRSLDIGTFNGRIFTYTASFGAFTKTSYSTPQGLKNALGHFAYILSGVKDVFEIHPEHIRIESDGDSREGDYIFGAVCNSTSLGGLLRLNEGVVDMNDGKFEVLLIRAPKNIAELVQIVNNLNLRRFDGDLIQFFDASQIKVTSDDAIDWTLDGECEKGVRTAVIENKCGALRLIAPADKGAAL